MPRPKIQDEPIRDGDAAGSATVFYSQEHRCAGHLNAVGEFVPHQAPPGWKHTPHGLVPAPVKEEKDNG